MGNMSYCRFENTYNDLDDCYTALGEKSFDEYKKPKFQKGDRCVFVYPVGKYKILSVLDSNMVIQDEPFWNEERNEWSYPIVGKSNPTEENFLILYNGQNEGDVVEQK